MLLSILHNKLLSSIFPNYLPSLPPSQLEKALGARPILTTRPAGIKEQFNALVAALAAQRGSPDSSIQTRDASVDGVLVRVYTPPNASEDLPLGAYFHGG